ncbi:exocyst subunit exo70 family protein [Medicago truncatula]|uniref:Exocyst subunit Exo70 family protein n=1 Tax=Medicago truncatula TaxID=3880 RepID=G7K8M0_MEDTR|nr:exocyst subunit exo70 family protein [Medicago truncatula]
MTVHMLIKVQRWLLQTKVWRFVGFASAAVGLVCYALSSSFNYLFGNWNLLKIILYTVFSFIICIMILYENIWKQSRSLRFKAHTAFLVLTITSVYSFYFDKVVNGKPDAYSLISCAAFAIMSLSLSRQSHCGFEVDLLYFFLGCLTVLLMKIKFQLFIIGAGLIYSLIIFRSSFSSVEEIGFCEFQDENSVIIEVDSPQLANTDIASTMEQLKNYLNMLHQKNLNLVDMLLKHVNEYDDSELMLPASEIALKILFPFEQRLCDHVFSGFASSATRCFTEVFHGSTFQLLNFANAVADGSPSIWCLFKMLAIFETLHHLISKFHLGPDSSVKEAAVTVQNRLGEAIRDLFLKLNYLTFRVPAAKKVSRSDGRHHPTAVQIISYVTSACRSRHTLEQVLQEYPKVNNGVVVKDSFIEQMEWIMDMLEKRLTYKSKEYRELALRYLFMMNNRRHIEAMIKSLDLETIFGNDWFQRNQAKFQQDLDLYQRYSWNKVLEFLKLDNNDCAALNGDVSNWFVYDKKLKEEIIISVANTLLPVYGIFIGRFRDCLGIHANQCIRYGMFEIQDRLNNLFLIKNS